MEHLNKPRKRDKIYKREAERQFTEYLQTVQEKIGRGDTLDTQNLKTLYADILNPKDEFTPDTKKLMKILQKERRSERRIRGDLADIFNIDEDHISLTKEEVLSGDIKYHYGDLDFDDLTTAEGLNLPDTVGGDLNFRELISTEGLKLPKTVQWRFDSL